ncbi:lactoylglutathione lyase [Lactobacillus sp. S2-2]|uniref:VOC family protein n=1 Tax=Lactobacillus sp. S2-2 TaxID=2692917 RepID=UPI001F23B91D|nr:VOC family protein [Lactobacillus sp. S2-2]MCF6514722.1 lactoylglutathione lyase [Lactobacillus sp. S2-2]
MKVKDIDNITIYIEDLNKTMRFYHETLDLPIVKKSDYMITFQLGKQKLNCSLINDEDNSNNLPSIGSGNLTILVKDPIEVIKAHLENYFIDLIEFSKENKSIKFLDPDQNLIEIISNN